jgi:hypothetical protein
MRRHNGPRSQRRREDLSSAQKQDGKEKHHLIRCHGLTSFARFASFPRTCLLAASACLNKERLHTAASLCRTCQPAWILDRVL